MGKSYWFKFLKGAFVMSSQVFTAVTIFDITLSFIRGNIDISHETILRNLSTIIICIIALFIFNHLKIKLWVKYILIYTFLVGFVLGITWILGQVFEPRTGADYLLSWGTSSLIFAIMVGLAWIQHFRERKKKGVE